MGEKRETRNALDILLQMEIPKPETADIKIKRLSRQAGADVIFSIKQLTYSRVTELQKQEGQGTEFDLHLALAGITSPDLKDAALLEKYDAPTPAELLKKMLLPGEITDVARAIERKSGYRIANIEEIKKK